MTEIKVHPEPFFTFANGHEILLTRESGIVQDGISKAGDQRDLTYQSGSPLLADADGNILAGPIDIEAITRHARSIIEGNTRAATEPGVALRLATALLFVTEALRQFAEANAQTKAVEQLR